MPRNGAGTYTLPEAPFVFDTVISETSVNSDFSDIASALTQSIAADGQTPITANLIMSGYKHTGVTATSGASSRTEYAAGGVVQDNVVMDAGVTAGSSTVYTATLSPSITAYVDKSCYRVQFDEACGNNPTINFNSVGAKKIYQMASGSAVQLVANDVLANQVWQLRYDSSLDAAAGGFILMNYVTAFSITGLTETTTVDYFEDFFPLYDTSATANRKARPGYFLGFMQGHIFGLDLTNNGSDANNDIDIAVGSAVDNTVLAYMRLTSAITKRLDANWAVGTNQGGLDTGAKANNTVYFLWLIQRSDTGVVDVLFSASSTAPTMPANYDRKALIGATRTDGSANIRANYFMKVLPGGRRTFTSDNQSIPSASTTAAVPHSLGAEPTSVQIWFVCTTASQGYSIGDKFLAFVFQDSSNQNFATQIDSTNVTFSTSSSGTILVQSKSAFTQVAMTTANFRFIVKAIL